MPQLVILCGDRSTHLLTVLRHCLKKARRPDDTADPQIMVYDDPERLVDEAVRRHLRHEKVVVTTGYLYESGRFTGEYVVRVCTQRQIPVVLVSGASHGTDASFDRTRNLARYYCQKPFNRQVIVDLVHAADREQHGAPVIEA